MADSKAKKVNLKKLTPEERMKYEIAGELGVLEKVLEDGWKCLTSKETGKIGGIMAGRKKGRKMGKKK